MIKELFDINSSISHGMFLVNVIGMDNYLSEEIIGLNNETDLLGAKTSARPCPENYMGLSKIFKFTGAASNNQKIRDLIDGAVGYIIGLAVQDPNSPAAHMLNYFLAHPNMEIVFSAFNSFLPGAPIAVTSPSNLFGTTPKFVISINMYDFGPTITKISNVVHHLNMLPIPFIYGIPLTSDAIVMHEFGHIWEILNFKPPNTALAAVKDNYNIDINDTNSTIYIASETRAQKWEAIHLRNIFGIHADFTDPSFFYLNNLFPVSLIPTRSDFEPFTTYVP